MRRILRLLACAVAGIVLGLTLYSGLVYIGLARSLLAPTLRGDIALARGDRPGLRVLFVGNSFTFKNSLPALVHDLAAADPGATPIYSVEYAAPGWSLHQAAKDDGLTKLLREVHWDVVVLQEKSWLLSFSEQQWHRSTYPFARDLHEKISAAGARTLLFMTWGYVLGDRWNEPHDTYAEMQSRLPPATRGSASSSGPRSRPSASPGRRRLGASRVSIFGRTTASIPAGAVRTSLRACSTWRSLDVIRLEAASQLASSLGKRTSSRRWLRTCTRLQSGTGRARSPCC